jgi:hypothetical protein
MFLLSREKAPGYPNWPRDSYFERLRLFLLCLISSKFRRGEKEVKEVVQLPQSALPSKWRLHLPLIGPERVPQHPSHCSLTALQNSGVDYICCPPKKDSVDTKLKDGLSEFMRTNRSQASQHLIVVISGDRRQRLCRSPP